MVTKIIRRTHMYLALFLAPWMLMYALSTLAMNHRAFLREIHGAAPPQFLPERELTYSGSFDAEAKPEAIALALLHALELDGAFSARRGPAEGTLTIHRLDLVSPRRITYRMADRHVTVERQQFRLPAFLERMHRRRGYEQPFVKDRAWASSVDLVIVAMLFWVASGLWMWWEMRATRRWGALSAAAGLAWFGFFLVTI